MKKLNTSLTQSVAQENLADVLATIGDVSIDAAISSGAIDGVPVLGILTGS